MNKGLTETRLKYTVFIVEATSFEQFSLWKENADESPNRDSNTKGVSWEQVNPGELITIGKVGKMPVCLQTSFIKIDGQMVMFWELSSQVADYRMAEKWLKKNFKRKYDGGRPAECGAWNFGHCLGAIRDINKKK